MFDEQQGLIAVPGPTVGQAMQQVKTQYTTAISVQKPRDLKKIEVALVAEATLAGEEFFYAWGAGKDRIDAPSINLALAAARCYGNCAIEAQAVQETPTAWIFNSAFIDLETGFTMCRAFEQPKNWTVYGKLDEARKRTIRFQLGQSKAHRNVILNCLPTGLINAAWNAAHGKVREGVVKQIEQEGLDKVVGKALARLGEFGISEADVLAKFGRLGVLAFTVDDVVLMKADWRAITNEREAPLVLYPPVKGDGANPPGVTAEDVLTPRTEREPLDDAKRPFPQPDAAPQTGDRTGTRKPSKPPAEPMEMSEDDIQLFEQKIDGSTTTEHYDAILERLFALRSARLLRESEYCELLHRIGERSKEREITPPAHLPVEYLGDQNNAAASVGLVDSTLTAATDRFDEFAAVLGYATDQVSRDVVLAGALAAKGDGSLSPTAYDALVRVGRELRSAAQASPDDETDQPSE